MTPADVALGEIGWAVGTRQPVLGGVPRHDGGARHDRLVWSLAAVPVCILIAFAFASVGMAVTTYMRSWADFEYVPASMLPLFLFSATFYPLSSYGEWGWVVQLSPLYHGVALVRAANLGTLDSSALGHVAVLVVLAIVGLSSQPGASSAAPVAIERTVRADELAGGATASDLVELARVPSRSLRHAVPEEVRDGGRGRCPARPHRPDDAGARRALRQRQPAARPVARRFRDGGVRDGCFWGAERLFWQTPGVYSTSVGYAGGFTPNPTYEEVCSGRTGHAEVVLVVFDPAVVSFDAALQVFWENHDPTQGMRQGNDVGTQYRSAIYLTDESQRRPSSRAARCSRRRSPTPATARSRPRSQPLGDFFYAEPYHQQYLAKNPNGYCGIGGTGVSCPVRLTRAVAATAGWVTPCPPRPRHPPAESMQWRIRCRFSTS